MNRTNLILLSFNLLLLGVMLGAGVMLAPRLMHGMMPHQLLERQLGPGFHQTLVDKMETAEPGWGGKLKVARTQLQQAIMAEPFDPAAFQSASNEFDRLIDEFHAIVRTEMHNRIINAPAGERQGLGKGLSQMPLPLVDEPQDGPGMDRAPDRGPPPA